MYYVFFMTENASIGLVYDAKTHSPAKFTTEDDAYDCIAENMVMENHPRFMWIKEVKYADSGQPDSPVSDCP